MAFSGVGVGSIVILPWLQHIIDQVGWRQACWIMAIVLCVVLVPLNVLCQRQRPQDLGLEPDGDAMPSATGHDEDTHSNVVDPDWVATEWTLGLAMRTTRFWWVFGGFFSGLFAWYAVQVHQTTYLIETGFDPGLAAYALGLVGLTGIVGQIALGHLSDRMAGSGPGRRVDWAMWCVTCRFSSCPSIQHRSRCTSSWAHKACWDMVSPRLSVRSRPNFSKASDTAPFLAP